MTEQTRRKKNMVYTPNDHIPIGEAIKRPDGSHAIRVKNPKTKKEDEISLDGLFEAVVHAANEAYAETRNEQGLAAQYINNPLKQSMTD